MLRAWNVGQTRRAARGNQNVMGRERLTVHHHAVRPESAARP